MFNEIQKYSHSYIVSNDIANIIAGDGVLSAIGVLKLGGVCSDYSGNIFVTDELQHVVIKITSYGQIIILAGSLGVPGNNGALVVDNADARFNSPTGICSDKSGNLYVCDTGNNQIRKISVLANKVGLVAGRADGSSGTESGDILTARLNGPKGVVVDNSGFIYIADTLNHSIRIVRGSEISTIAGLSGTSGNHPTWVEQTSDFGIVGSDARFDSPQSLAVNASGYIFVADTKNYVVKRIDQAGWTRVFSGSGVFGDTLADAETSRYRNIISCQIANKSNSVFIIDFYESGSSRIIKLDDVGIPYLRRSVDVAMTGNYYADITHDQSNNLIPIYAEYGEQSSSSSVSSLSSASSSSESSESSSRSSPSSQSSSSSSSSSISSQSSRSSLSSSSSSSQSSVSSLSSSTEKARMIVEIEDSLGATMGTFTSDLNHSTGSNIVFNFGDTLTHQEFPMILRFSSFLPELTCGANAEIHTTWETSIGSTWSQDAAWSVVDGYYFLTDSNLAVKIVSITIDVC